MKLKIELPENVQYILNRLYSSGFDGYVVGGCVRDSILGREPDDWDITTNALPCDVTSIFGEDNTIPTGIKFGTVTVLFGGNSFEITTYRIDRGYSDCRRPDEVEFTSSIDEELGRRDFTINAMAYNEESGLIDLFGGYDDLKGRSIRCVGNPDDRFKEDALRMMRAVRFAAQLGFTVDKSTLDSIRRNRDLIRKVSAERVNIELNKMLLSSNPSKMELLFSSGMITDILPEAEEAYREPQLFEDGIKVIERLQQPSLVTSMAVFLYSLRAARSSEEVRSILRRLKYDTETIKRISELIEFYEYTIVDDKKEIRRALSRMGEETFKDLLKIDIADSSALGQQDMDMLLDVQCKMNEIIESDECYSLKDLAIDGRNLMQLGIGGREVGNLLKRLLDVVIDEPELNTKEKLIIRAKELLGK